MGVKLRLKRLLLTLARPISRRIWARIEMQIAAADRGEQLLQRHPAAFLDAVSTVAALGRQVRSLQQQVAALQQRDAGGSGGEGVKLVLSADDTAVIERLLQATVNLRLHGMTTTADSLEIASAAAAWLRGHDFTDVRIDADTVSPAITVSARLSARRGGA